MTLAAARRAALAALLLIAGPAAAQRTLPSQFSTGPQPPSPNQSQGVPAPKFELPSTLPDIPPGVAIIPPSDAGRQPPATAAALPTTTPLPPSDVASPIAPLPPAGAPAAAPVPTGAQRPASPQVAPPGAAPAQPSIQITATPPAAPAAPAVSPALTGRPDVVPFPSTQMPSVSYPMFSGADEGRTQLIRLRDMGRRDGLHLEGTVAEAGVTFTSRQDDAFVSSRLSLSFSYSAAVARDDAELAVHLNGELIGAVAFGKTAGLKARAEFTFNPALLTTENRLSFRFAMKGAGNNACKLLRDRTIWLNVEPSTFIYLGATQLPLADNLGFLPRPFADSKDPLPLKLPFLLPADPEPGVLKAAGMAAAYFGLVAQNKGATFPVQFDGVPAGNAVALVQGGHYPAGVAPIPGEGPRVAVVANPAQVDSKLLLIVGADAAELQAAAATLAVGPARLTGGWSVAHEPLPPAREAYDAPKWISNSRPVKLGSLVSPSALNGRRIIDSPQVPFRSAPDLFFGALSGGKLYLRVYRADDTWIEVGESRLFVDLNQKVVGEVPLEPKLKVLSRLKEWVFPSRADERVSQVLLPGYQLFSSNLLDFRFELKARQDADCASLDWSDRTGIDPDSTIDLTSVAHFAAFPNLAMFAGAGFPFTKYADLSDTAFVMPPKPGATETQVMLNLLGMMADATGVAATRFDVVDASHVDGAGDRNLVVVGLESSQPLLKAWEANNTVHITPTSVAALPPPTVVQRFLQPDNPRAPYYRGAALELARANLGKPFAYLSSFWSPLNQDRLVVMMGGTDGSTLLDLSKQLNGLEAVSNIQGDFYYFVNGKGEFYSSGRWKFVGGLPIWWRIQWLTGSFGVLAFIFVICAIFVFAATIERFAAHRANRLLGGTSPMRR